MTRSLVALVLRTGIPLSAWLDEDDRAIFTAISLLTEDDEPDPGPGPLMSG